MNKDLIHFESAHQVFVEKHASSRSGERKGRLMRGHNHAEKLFLEQVWWPLFASFDNLHPEYEILDWNRKSQFLDFAFITPLGRFGIEIDGFQSHVREMDRERFSYGLNRDTFLTGMGWRMIHFSYDDVQQRAEICRMLLHLALGPITLREKSHTGISRREKEMIRLLWIIGDHASPKQICEALELDFRTVKGLLGKAMENGYVESKSKGKRARFYGLTEVGYSQLVKL